MWKKYLKKGFAIIIAGYLSFSSFILVKVITNDIILNSYKIYAEAKLNTNVFLNKAENLTQKGKLLFDKILHKERVDELEKQYKEKLQAKEKELEKLKSELEFNKKVLAGLPYIIALIIFIISFVKIDEYGENFLKKLS